MEGIEVDIVEAFAIQVGCTVTVSCKPGRSFRSKSCIHDNVSVYRLSLSGRRSGMIGYSDAWPEVA
jgi:hypothetical protein